VAGSRVKIRKVESISDEMQKIHTQVSQRACEIFENAGMSLGRIGEAAPGREVEVQSSQRARAAKRGGRQS
jgi:hypothetical protein